MDMLVSAVSVKLSVSGNGKVLLRETVFAAARTSSVRLLLLSFQCGSPSPKAKFIGAFTRCHHLGKIGIQSGTDFFEPDCVRSEFSTGKNQVQLQSIEHTNQSIHALIPQDDLYVSVGFGHSCSKGCCSGSCFWFRRSLAAGDRHSEG